MGPMDILQQYVNRATATRTAVNQILQSFHRCVLTIRNVAYLISCGKSPKEKV